MIHVYDRDGQFVASINRQHKLAGAYRPQEPWMLLFRTGRVDHFVGYLEARLEAMKTWPACRFRKN